MSIIVYVYDVHQSLGDRGVTRNIYNYDKFNYFVRSGVSQTPIFF